MKKIATMTVLIASVLLLAGCPKKPMVSGPATTKSQVPASATTAGADGAATRVSPLGDGASTSAGGAGDANAARSHNVIYFDFDKSEIKPEFADIVTGAAHNLSSHPALKVKLEGNTDERGTREYNIGLGERRAQAVRRALLLQGAAESQITTVSYGAERPAVEGDDEAAWSQNRRVELNWQSAAGQP
ncbi:MAG: peptidoglycan-associated lipoprotein Pal [Steroidobacterales bacterium]